ncbi:MAG TPA: trehalose-phosphatase [Devosia sp.]|nr:trehalose-phosphatase [Devosia sp.]
MTQFESAFAQHVPQLAIFTDFDGTLVERAENPDDDIAVPDTLTQQLERTARELDHAFAVLTGREIADIDRYLAPLQLAVAGGHGRRRADGVMERSDPSALLGAEEITQQLQPFVDNHPGLKLESRDGAVELDFSRVPELEDAAQILMEEALHSVPDFNLIPGPMMIEARMRGISKGEALRAFMRETPFLGRAPIVIGDDPSDEDAFIAAQELGGVGIKLGEGETAARMRIADVASVLALLEGLGTIVARDRENLAH